MIGFTTQEEDPSPALVFPDRLYGREAAHGSLVQSWSDACRGERVLALVSGYAGIGKTSVVCRLRTDVQKAGGIFISGKHDESRRTTPYLGIAEALTNLSRQLMALPTAEFATRADELRVAVGGLGRVILDLAPALGPILGTPPPIPSLPGLEARQRCAVAFRNFIRVVGTPQHPLTFFLDDMQWMDGASLDLFRAVACDRSRAAAGGGLLLVAAYRENEVDASHPFSRAVRDAETVGLTTQRIPLGGLAAGEVAAFLNDVLDPKSAAPRAEVLVLADAMHAKTDGNPFFIRLLLRHLCDSEALTKREGRWEWNAETVAQSGITENVAELLAARLFKLDEDARKVLSTAAFLGSSFTVKLLSEAVGCSALWALDLAAREGLLEIRGDTATFVHDRVQQAAFALVPAQEQAAARLAAGRRILQAEPVDALNGSIYVTATQFLGSAPLLADPAERIGVAGLHLRAGTRARMAAAFGEAHAFLSAGLALLPEDAWKTHFGLALDLHREAQLAAHASSHFDEAETLFKVLNNSSASPLALAKCTACQVNQFLMQGRYRESMELGFDFLNQLGMGVPPDAAGIERDIAFLMPEADMFLRKPGALENLPSLPPMGNPRLMAAVAMVNEVAASLYFLGEWRSYLLLCLRAFVWTARYGTSLSAGVNILRLIQAHILFRNDYSTARTVGAIGLIAARRQGDRYWLSRTLHYHTMFCSHWYRPLRESLSLGREACIVLQECGNPIHAAFTHFVVAFIAGDSGVPLSEAQQEAEAGLAGMRKNALLKFESSFAAMHRMIEILRGESTASDQDSDSDPAENISNEAPNFFRAGVQVYATLMAVLARRWEVAVRRADAVDASSLMTGFPMLAAHRFHGGIARARLAATMTGEARKELVTRARADLEQFRAWAVLCPVNFAHKAALLAAELASLHGEHDQAAAFYEEAAAGARQNGYLHDEALACELAGRFHLSDGGSEKTLPLLSAARCAFADWGAFMHVKRLENEFPVLAGELKAKSADPVQPVAAKPPVKDTTAVEQRPIQPIDSTPQKLTEEDMRANVRRLLLAYDSVGDGVWDWDLDTNKVYYSTRWKSLLGYAEEDVSDTFDEWKRLTITEDIEPTLESIRRQMREGEHFQAEFRMRCKDGSVKWLLSRGKVIERGGDGKAKRLIGTNTDITERKRAEREIRDTEDLYRRAITAADAVPYFHDYATKSYTFMGEGIVQLTGYRREELTPEIWHRMSVKVLLHDEAEGLDWAEAQRRGRAGEFKRWRSDNLIHTQDGRRRWVADAAINVTDEQGRVTGAIGVLTDITDLKRTQEDLEGIVQERTASLEASNKELEAFAQSAAHDLRSPLTGISGFCQLLQERHSHNLDEKGRQYVAHIFKDARRMSQLINDLMMLSRLRQSDVQRESVDMSAMVQRVADDLRTREPGRQIECVVAPGATVQADPNLLRIALGNLLNNAWKYTSKTEQPRVEFGSTQEEGGTVYYVRDNGAGFDMVQYGRLFNAFQRLHTGNDFPGTGIGLSIVQRIIKRHGGRIRAEGEVGKGATFYFTLG